MIKQTFSRLQIKLHLNTEHLATRLMSCRQSAVGSALLIGQAVALT